MSSTEEAQTSESTQVPHGGLAMVHLRVDDADRAMRFFGALFGWQAERVPFGGHVSHYTINTTTTIRILDDPGSPAVVPNYAVADGGSADGELVLGDLRLDPSGRRVFRRDREVQLSKTEFDLLALLVANRGIVLDHSTIYDRIWHYDFGPDSKNLAVYIGYLRRKTEAEGEPRLVHTVRGVGYTARVDGPPFG